ncbi:MAG: hypothetical protein Aurels2KO_48770 [Aureliella sp.]
MAFFYLRSSEMSNPFEVTSDDPSATTLPPGTRPPSATVFGILNLVWGILGICSTVASIGFIAAAANPDFGMTEAPGMEQFADASYRAFLTVVNILSLALAVLLIASGIGLLKFRPWGRSTAIWYAALTILVLIGTTAGTFVLLLLPSLTNAATPEEQMQAYFGIGGGLVGALFGLIYPVLLLIFMNRQSFKAAINA